MIQKSDGAASLLEAVFTGVKLVYPWGRHFKRRAIGHDGCRPVVGRVQAARAPARILRWSSFAFSGLAPVRGAPQSRVSFQTIAVRSRGSICLTARFVSAERSAVRRSYIDCKFSQNCAVPPK
jgi:hypothetical protein